MPSLAIWASNPSGSLPRQHARQAFSYQCVYLPIHVSLTVLMVFGQFAPLLICVSVGFLLEVPQFVRAATGRPPLRLVPFDILRE